MTAEKTDHCSNGGEFSPGRFGWKLGGIHLFIISCQSIVSIDWGVFLDPLEVRSCGTSQARIDRSFIIE